MYKQFGINEEVIELAHKTEEQVKEQFKKIEEVCEYNSLKILSAFQKYNLSEMHFNSTTGYGYSDVGRETIEKIFAEVLNTEDSLVRGQFISGTHALTVALFAFLRPNDIFLSISGKPYDTIPEFICNVHKPSSIKTYGLKYEQIDMIENDFDYEKVKERVSKNDIKLIEIQRSRGYSLRDSITLDKIQKVIKTIREVNEKVIIMVDNCYGELVEKIEPTDLGADVIVGSLIKNLGAGIATSGAYIVGRKNLIELAGERLTGIGKEIGPSLNQNTNYLKGLFFAPHAVYSSLKTMIFASKMLEELGYDTKPKYNEKRADIVQSIVFKNKEKLIKFCQGIQAGSPIDSFVSPIPSNMSGYEDEVIMAAGTFVDGATIELSCDGPIREPFIAYMQGGLTYPYGKIGVLKAIELIEQG